MNELIMAFREAASDWKVLRDDGTPHHNSYRVARDGDLVRIEKQVIGRGSKLVFKPIGTAKWDDHHGLYARPGGSVPAEVYDKLEQLLREAKRTTDCARCQGRGYYPSKLRLGKIDPAAPCDYCNPDDKLGVVPKPPKTEDQREAVPPILSIKAGDMKPGDEYLSGPQGRIPEAPSVLSVRREQHELGPMVVLKLIDEKYGEREARLLTREPVKVMRRESLQEAYLKDMARAAKQAEKDYEKRKKAATTYGVFLYNAAGQYPPEKAVKVFKREQAAEAHAKTLNEEVKTRMADWGPHGYVVRDIVGDFDS